MQSELVITAVSTITPYGLGVDAFAQGIATAPVQFTPLTGSYAGSAEVAMVPEYDACQLLAIRSISTFDRLTQHVCVAVDQLHKTMGLGDSLQFGVAPTDPMRQGADRRVSFVLGSSGPLQSIMDFDLQTIAEPRYVQASIYPNVVFNVPASYAAIRHGIRGSCITLTDGDTSSLQAFAVAAAQLESGRIDLALVGGAEEVTPAYALYRAALASEAGQAPPPMSEGATVFAVEHAGPARQAGRSSIAGLLGCSHVFSPDDVVGGIRACLRGLRRRVGALLDDVGVVCAEASIDLDTLELGHCRRLTLTETLGHTGAMYGALATLNAMVRTDVKPGERVLLLQGSREGPCAALLLHKHRHLTAPGL